MEGLLTFEIPEWSKACLVDLTLLAAELDMTAEMILSSSNNGYLLVYITHLAMSWNGRHTITIFMCEVNHIRQFWQPEKWLQAMAVTHLDLFIVCNSLLVENWHECNNKYWWWRRGLCYLDDSLSSMISMLVSAVHATTRNHCVSIQVYSQVHVLFYCLTNCSIQGGSHRIIIKLSLCS